MSDESVRHTVARATVPLDWDTANDLDTPRYSQIAAVAASASVAAYNRVVALNKLQNDSAFVVGDKATRILMQQAFAMAFQLYHAERARDEGQA